MGLFADGLMLFGDVLATQPHHGHSELHHKQFDLTLLDKLGKRLNNSILLELLSGEDQSLRGKVANSSVKHFHSEQLFNQ